MELDWPVTTVRQIFSGLLTAPSKSLGRGRIVIKLHDLYLFYWLFVCFCVYVHVCFHFVICFFLFLSLLLLLHLFIKLTQVEPREDYRDGSRPALPAKVRKN